MVVSEGGDDTLTDFHVLLNFSATSEFFICARVIFMETIRSPYFGDVRALITVCNCIMYVFIHPVPMTCMENGPPWGPEALFIHYYGLST